MMVVDPNIDFFRAMRGGGGGAGAGGAPAAAAPRK
jgi:hypothetical protein